MKYVYCYIFDCANEYGKKVISAFNSIKFHFYKIENFFAGSEVSLKYHCLNMIMLMECEVLIKRSIFNEEIINSSTIFT